jgi:hypothetical protein
MGREGRHRASEEQQSSRSNKAITFGCRMREVNVTPISTRRCQAIAAL